MLASPGFAAESLAWRPERLGCGAWAFGTHRVQPVIRSSVAYSESALWRWLQGQSSASVAPLQSVFLPAAGNLDRSLPSGGPKALSGRSLIMRVRVRQGI